MTSLSPQRHRRIRPRTTGRLVIAGCSVEKAPCTGLLPAIDLYNGGCIPPLRARLGPVPALRARIRFLSAEHGLVSADTPLADYDRPLDRRRAAELRPQVTRQLAGGRLPSDILLIAEPLYLVLIGDLLALRRRPRIHWVPDHGNGWPQAAAVLDRWGW